MDEYMIGILGIAVAATVLFIIVKLEDWRRTRDHGDDQ